jgi:hypothetical protein
VNRKARPLVAASLLLVLLGCVSTPSEKNSWAVGEWRFRQTFTAPVDRPAVLTGTIQIERGKHRFTGRIYFDTRKEWEGLDDVQVSSTSIQFSRALYQEEFEGHRTETGIKGKWDTSSGRSLAGRWEAERN